MQIRPMSSQLSTLTGFAAYSLRVFYLLFLPLRGLFGDTTKNAGRNKPGV